MTLVDVSTMSVRHVFNIILPANNRGTRQLVESVLGVRGPVFHNYDDWLHLIKDAGQENSPPMPNVNIRLSAEKVVTCDSDSKQSDRKSSRF